MKSITARAGKNMQKQKKNEALRCTFRKCKNLQGADGEFCKIHQPKKGRDDLIEALNQLDEWADQTTYNTREKLEQQKRYNLLMDFIIYS